METGLKILLIDCSCDDIYDDFLRF